ncbi:MAG: hypothetical protein ACLT69_12730 [Intestinibacter bartlettii]
MILCDENTIYLNKKINLKKKGAGTTNEKLAVVENGRLCRVAHRGCIVSFLNKKKMMNNTKYIRLKFMMHGNLTMFSEK